MSLWNKTGTKPQNLTRAEKRNVVATDRGWIRRQTYTDQHSNVRTKDEILVPIGGMANSTNMGFPDVDDMWHSVSVGANTITVNTWVSFNEPVAANTALKIDVANTAAGNAIVAYSNTTTYIANNTVLFRWTPTVAGTYKVEAQTIANSSTVTAPYVRSLNTGTEAANLVIGASASNTAGSVVIS